MKRSPLIKLAIKNGNNAEILARRLQLPLENSLTEYDMLIGWQENKLALFPQDSGAIFIDFVGGRLGYRRHYGGGKNQPLAKAIGISAKKLPSVIDATAGMGRDSFVLACLGCQVTLLERSPIVAELLVDALLRASQSEETAKIAARMSVQCADSSDYLSQLPQADVVYLDPMYPEKRKSAAVKKDMRALQLLVGKDTDSDKLLASALQMAKSRVVVKRPKTAPPLSTDLLTSAISSPNTRYDIYSIKAIA